MMPATMGADTEVPVWPSVQRCRRSVVTCTERSCWRCSQSGLYPMEHPKFPWDAASGELSLWVPKPAMAPTSLGCSEPQKKGLQTHLVHEKTSLLLFSFAERCKKCLKRGKKDNFAPDQLEKKVRTEQGRRGCAPEGAR